MIFGIFKTREEKERERAEQMKLEESRVSEEKKQEMQGFCRSVCSSLRYFRLRADLAAVEKRMAENSPVDTASGGALRRFWDSAVTNPSRRNVTERLSADKQVITERLTELQKNFNEQKESYAYGESDEAMTEALDRLFEEDVGGISRTAFALSFALGDEGEYVCGSESLGAVSRVLFGDEKKIDRLLHDFRDNYYAIARGPLLGKPDGALILSLAPAIPSDREDPRRLTAEDFNLLLAARATFAKEAKANLGVEEFKALADEYLQTADDLRSDAEYLWIVERTDASAAKIKVASATRFIERLASIVGI